MVHLEELGNEERLAPSDPNQSYIAGFLSKIFNQWEKNEIYFILSKTKHIYSHVGNDLL